MKVVWNHAPISTNEITDRLVKTTTWSPKTIQTLIKRLVTKGVLTYEKQSRVFVYTPLVDKDEYIGQESRSFLKRFYNGDISAMLSAYIDHDRLSEQEISALFALESGIITPDQSHIPWDGTHYRYDHWNADQTLASAMQNSVTWYFQAIDRQNTLETIEQYIADIGYGNQTIGSDINTYWIDASLKISPVEQIELLQKFRGNEFDFSPENIEAVKTSIRLASCESGALYGKTGTEEVNKKNVSGWFIGYIETDETTYYFATNLQNDALAFGPAAAELTFSILSDLGIWEDYHWAAQ